MAAAPVTAMPAAVIHLLHFGAGEVVLIGDGGLCRHGRLGIAPFQIMRRNQQRRGTDRGACGSDGTGTSGNAESELQKFTTFHVFFLRMDDGTTVPHQP